MSNIVTCGANTSHSQDIPVGKLIRKTRNAKGLTLDDLSKRTGIAMNTLSNYETGKLIPSAKTLDIIADGLNIKRCAICSHHYKLESAI